MEYNQLENIYISNGLNDFLLKDTDDLIKIHGINYKIKGYENLDKLNKSIYKGFLINFFNTFGLELRSKIVPLKIFYARDTSYCAKTVDDENCYVTVKRIIEPMGINSTLKSIEYNNCDCEYVGSLEKEEEYYLRFEYLIDNENEWLHIKSEKSWY